MGYKYKGKVEVSWRMMAKLTLLAATVAVAMGVVAIIGRWLEKDINKLHDEMEYADNTLMATCEKCGHQMKVQNRQITKTWKCWCGGTLKTWVPEFNELLKHMRDISLRNKMATEMRKSGNKETNDAAAET